MPNYPRWNPPYRPPSSIAGSYLNRMSVVDPLVSRVRMKLRFDIGFGHLPGMPIDETLWLATFPDNRHFYRPIFVGQLDPFINSTVEFLWAVSDEGFEPLTYAGIVRIQNFGIVQFAGSIREWPQEGSESPVRSPWRQTWTFSITNLLLPDDPSFYDVIPIPYDCSILE